MLSPPLEVEAKFRGPRQLAVGHLQSQLGIVPDPPRVEVDTYLCSPDRDFAQTDEALRLRQVEKRNRLTYKGPKLGAVGKSRREIEVELAEGEQAARLALDLFQALGFRTVRHVKKTRTVFPIPARVLAPFPLEICLDEVEGLGCFLELETSGTIEQVPELQAHLQSIARTLGLGPEERRSYLEMLLELDKKASS